MTTERRGLFVFRTSEDGTKCAAECPFLFEPKDEDGFVDTGFCLLPNEADLAFDEEGGWLRNARCLAASEAAREAEVDALRRGYGAAFGGRDIDEEIERIRGES